MTEISKGVVGGYFLFEAIKHRSDNQDIKWYEYKDDEGKTGDLRPLFPLAPYLLVADFLVKAGNGTLDRLSTQEITEGILGTRLAGAQLYVIDQFYKSFSSEAEVVLPLSDNISGQRAAEAIGTMVGELMVARLTPTSSLALYETSAAHSIRKKRVCVTFAVLRVRLRLSEVLMLLFVVSPATPHT